MEIRHIYYKTEDAAYTISYVLTRKQVKYINLRIKSNGEVAVSAHRRVPATYVDKFVESKAPFILEALERVEKRREETGCLLYTSPSPRDGLLCRMPSSA